MNLDDIRPTPGKTRVYLKSLQVYPKNTWTRPDQNVCRARRHIAFSQGQCATHGAQRLLKYAQRTICCRYACLKAAAAKASGGRGMPMAVRTMRLRCVLLQDRGGAWHALLRSQSAHRNEAAQQAGCCQQGPMLPHARIVQRGPAYTGFSDMRLFELEAICENCLARSRRRLRSRSSNENRKRRMLRRRLLSMRRIDRPPQAKKIWGLRRIVDNGGSLLAPGRATADLADVRGSR